MVIHGYTWSYMVRDGYTSQLLMVIVAIGYAWLYMACIHGMYSP